VLASTAKAQSVTVIEVPLWQRYTVKGEEFSVELPRGPGMKSFAVSQRQVQKKQLERRLESSSGSVLYAIYAYANLTPRQSLARFISEQTASYKKKLVTERVVQVNGFRGKEYSSLDQRNLFVEQFFATKRRLYRFSAYGANAEHPDVRQFFSSIMLGENPEAVAVSDGAIAPLETASEEKIYTAKEVDVKARITDKPPAGYTEEAKKNEISGSVILNAALSSTGEIIRIRVVLGLPFGLTERAIAAARKLKFTPAMKEGKPVSMWMQVKYDFNLN
jgi:TonB family protein